MVAHDQRVGTGLDRQPRIGFVLYAFEDELAAPALFHPLHIGPVQGRVELLRGPGAELRHIAHALDVADDVAKLAPFGARHP